MGKKKKVQAPVYQEFQDNEYIKGLREDLAGYRDLNNKLLYSLDVTDPNVQKAMQQVADDYTAAQWKDLNRQYIQEQNALNQRNYNRFGSLGSTGALYNQDALNTAYNDLATRVASSTASQYKNLMNNYYNQKLESYNAANNAYTGAGNATTTIDQNNWNIRNKNIEAKYVADVQNAANSGNWLGGMLSGAASGAATGASFGGPWGAVIGGVAGGALGAFGGSQSGSSGQAMSSGLGLGQSVGSLGSLGSNLNLNTKGSQVASNPYLSGAYWSRLG